MGRKARAAYSRKWSRPSNRNFNTDSRKPVKAYFAFAHANRRVAFACDARDFDLRGREAFQLVRQPRLCPSAHVPVGLCSACSIALNALCALLLPVPGRRARHSCLSVVEVEKCFSRTLASLDPLSCLLATRTALPGPSQAFQQKVLNGLSKFMEFSIRRVDAPSVASNLSKLSQPDCQFNGQAKKTYHCRRS